MTHTIDIYIYPSPLSTWCYITLVISSTFSIDWLHCAQTAMTDRITNNKQGNNMKVQNVRQSTLLWLGLCEDIQSQHIGNLSWEESFQPINW